MSLNDRKTLLYFTTRTGMYIDKCDYLNIVSFITGFETGKNKKDFTELLKNYITNRYGIKAGASGWPGQIKLLSEKINYSEVTTFKKVSLEVLLLNEIGVLNSKLGQILKVRIQSVIERIQSVIERIESDRDLGIINFWVEEWLSLCSIRSDLFRQIWTFDEFQIIQKIDNEVQENNIFKEKSLNIVMLVELKMQYNLLKG